MSSKHFEFKSAFSLVEISIVIVIIGILIAGISKGMDLYADFKLTTARNLTNNSIVNRIQGLTIWLESTSTKSFAKAEMSNNEAIALWNDINPQRPMKINVTQATANKRPTYVKNAINNLPALKFADNLELRSVDIVARDIFSPDQVTAFLVQNAFSVDTSSTTISWVATTNNTDGGTEVARFNFHAPGGTSVVFDYYNTLVSVSGHIPIANVANFLDRNKIISAIRNSNYTDIRINYNERSANRSDANSVFSQSLISPLVVGKFRKDSTYFFNGYIVEIIIFNRALSESERYEVEKYLSQKWGIGIK